MIIRNNVLQIKYRINRKTNRERLRGRSDMTRDAFIEVLVESKTSTATKILKYFLFVMTVIFAGGGVLFGMMLSLLFAIICGIAAYFIGLRAEIEYEYSYMDKELDIDIIYSKQKRKHLTTFDLSKMEVLAPEKSYHLDEYKNRTYKTCDYSSKMEANQDKRYVMYYSGEKKVVFEPTQEMIEAITYIAPRKVFRD